MRIYLQNGVDGDHYLVPGKGNEDLLAKMLKIITIQ